MATLVELTTLITAWGESRGIVANSTPFAQACKTHEELLELVEADTLSVAGFDASLQVKDAIGDVYVTLVMVCACNKTPITGMEYQFSSPDVNPDAVKSLCESFPYLVRSCALCSGIESSQNVQFDAMQMVDLLHDVCEHYELDLTECAEHAYETIKDRKGYLRPDGVFVKEASCQ